MKRKFLIINLFSIISIITFAQPIAMFDRTEYDFGTILWKKPVTATFSVRNRGNKPLVITDIRTSCGCTAAEWTQKPIPAGESGQVTATFDAKQLGRFNKSIGVYCNTEEPLIYLTLLGTVASQLDSYDNAFPLQMGTVRLDRNVVEFNEANRGESPTAEINIINIGDTNYEPILMHLPSYIKAEAIPSILTRKETGKIRFTLDTKQLKHLGLTQTSVYLSRYLGDKVSSDNEIVVSAILLPDFSKLTEAQKLTAPEIQLSSTEVDFGNMGTKNKLSQTVIVTNTGKSRLDVKEIQVFNPILSVSLKKRSLQPGESTKLKITANAQYLEKAKGTPRVLMITNDPSHPKTVIKAQVSR